MAPWLTGFGLLAFVSLTTTVFVTPPGEDVCNVVSHATSPSEQRVSFLAVGDINLGRAVGQEILKGDTLFPFAFVQDTFALYDIVFGNLECQLSDQRGETQHPRNNMVFTGPPAGSYSLKQGGVTVVSTANNHALDYGLDALEETINHLTNAGQKFCGTSVSDTLLFEPVELVHEGIRIAVFACTDIMNINDDYWRRFVTPADTASLFPRIRSCRQHYDYLVLSYHGGREYTERPTERTREFAQAALRSGVDLFLGHHPHVPQGLEEVDGKWIVYSLGNFVFRQPFDYWTQRSFAFSALITKTPAGTRLSGVRCIPVIAGSQPRFITSEAHGEEILTRLRALSNVKGEEVTWVE